MLKLKDVMQRGVSIHDIISLFWQADRVQVGNVVTQTI